MLYEPPSVLGREEGRAALFDVSQLACRRRDFYILCIRRQTSCLVQELVQLMAPINFLPWTRMVKWQLKTQTGGYPSWPNSPTDIFRWLRRNLINHQEVLGQTEKIPVSNFLLIFSCLPRFPQENTESTSPGAYQIEHLTESVHSSRRWQYRPIEISKITWTLVDLEIHYNQVHCICSSQPLWPSQSSRGRHKKWLKK